MQLPRLLANATLRSIRRGVPAHPDRQTCRKDAWGKAVKFCAAVCLLLLLFAGVPRTAAACEPGDPTRTTIFLNTNTGYQLRLGLWIQGDRIRGKLFVNPAHPGEGTVKGAIDGQIYPDKGMFLKVILEPPAPPGTDLLIWGNLTEGGGTGEVKETDWGVDVDPTIWIARTVKGCPKWPEDVFRSELANAADAQAASATPALAAANPLYACSADSWDPSVADSLGRQFVSDCAQKIVGVLPWGPDSGAAAARTGPGSLAWNACAASLSKQVSTIVLTMQRTCRTAKYLQDAKNRCVPVHTTRDGRMYQNEPSPFTSEGKDVQQCMTEVQRCFDRNNGIGAQESCANQVLACFDTGDDKRVTAVRLFAGGLSPFAKNTSVSRANLICLLTRSPSDAKSAFVLYRKNWSGLVGGLSNSGIGNAYADLAVSRLRCPATFTELAPSLFQRSSLSLFYVDRPDFDEPVAGTRLLAFNSDSGCLAKTPTAAAIPVVRTTPELSVRRSSSGSDRSFSPQTAVKRRLQGGAAAAASRGSSGYDTVKSNTNSAMDRLSGGDSMGGVTSPPYIPGERAAPAPRGGAAAIRAPTSSSGISTVKASGVSVPRPSTSSGSSGISTVQSSGMSVSRPSRSGVVNPSRPTSDTNILTRKSPADVFRRQQSDDIYLK